MAIQNQLATTLLLATVLNVAPVLADSMMNDHDKMQQPMQMETGAMQHEGQGVIKAVNVKENKIQIAHQAIPSLQWPAMTMWFPVRGALTENLKVGDTVRFILQQHRKQWIIAHVTKPAAH